MSHEDDIQSKLKDSDVANYKDSTESPPSTRSLLESLQEYSHKVVENDRQCDIIEGDGTSDTESGNGQSASGAADEMSDSEKLLQDSTPEKMSDTEQPRQTQSPTFEDSTIPKEDDIPDSDAATLSAITENEPWSRSDMESGEDKIPPATLTHAQGGL